MTLNVTVKNRIATYVSGQGIPVCGNTGDQVKFTFDEEWSQHETKTARFKWGGKVFDQEFTGNVCEIPNIDNTDSITVGVFVGEEENGEDELSTTDTRIPYRRSTRCGNNIPHGESGESYTNLAKGYAVSAKADADRTEELLTEYIDDVDALIGGEGVEGGGSVDSCEIYVAYYPDATNTLTIKTASEFWLEQHGEKPTIITQIVDTLPTVLKEADEENLILYAYILKSTGVGYLDAGGTTITLGKLAFSLDGFDKGWTTDINSVSDLGVYCVRTQGNSNAGGGIIDVTELPTEGIDEQSIYRRAESATAEWWLYESEYKGNYGALLEQEMGGTLTMLVCDELPQTFVASTQTAFTVYVMRNNGEMYVSLDGTTATPFLDLLVSSGLQEKPFHGVVGSPDEMTEEGYYTLIINNYSYHACKDGVWTELSNSDSGSSGGGVEFMDVAMSETDGSVTMTEEQFTEIQNNYENIVLRIVLEGSLFYNYRFAERMDDTYFYGYSIVNANGVASIGCLIIDTANKTATNKLKIIS